MAIRHSALSLVCSPEEFLAEGAGEVVVAALEHCESVGGSRNLHGCAAGECHRHAIDTHLYPLCPSVDGDFYQRVFGNHDGAHGERVW